MPKSKNQYCICSSNYNAIKHREIFLWGLKSRLLDIVENYLGLPAAYHGIYLRRDLAINIVRKSRLWHTDKEDRRMLKIIVHLNDVDNSNGAFQYIAKDFSDRIYRQLNYNHEYVKEERMKRVIPPSEWISCNGKAGTVILVDSASVFHRGQIPQTTDRLSLFFDYTSDRPLRPYYCKSSLPIEVLLALSPKLTSRQKSCVFWNRQLKKAVLQQD